jgi:hypothetical protein
MRRRLRPSARRRHPRDPSPRWNVVSGVSEKAPPDLPDVGEYRNWRPEDQERALAMLRERHATDWKPFYCPNPRCNGRPHGHWDFNHARADQRPPRWSDDWLVWLLSGVEGPERPEPGPR